MTRPNPIELNFEDLAGPGGAAPGPGVETPGGPPVGPETGGDLVNQIDGLMDRANTVITNIKELVSMWKGFNTNPGQGQGQGAGPAQQPYTPQPTLPQQLHRLLNVMYSAYGDITISQLIEGLVQQYGNTKLSAALKALERLQ